MLQGVRYSPGSFLAIAWLTTFVETASPGHPSDRRPIRAVKDHGQEWRLRHPQDAPQARS
jgi:hypothetical protein